MDCSISVLRHKVKFLSRAFFAGLIRLAILILVVLFVVTVFGALLFLGVPLVSW